MYSIVQVVLAAAAPLRAATAARPHRTLQRKSAVLYQLCHISSKRLEEKWHNWYSTALFLYKTSAPLSA